MPTQSRKLYSAFFKFFFFNDTATTEIYTLSLHDALPISAGAATDGRGREHRLGHEPEHAAGHAQVLVRDGVRDRKSTRLNSSHTLISYAVFCLKKKTHALKPHVRLGRKSARQFHAPADDD